MDYTQLRNELETDPLGLGYSSLPSLDNQADADLLNSLSTGRTRNRTAMTGREFKNEWDDAEFSALTDTQKNLLYSMAARDDLDPFGVDAQTVQDIFPGGGTTITALAAARVETISRATELGFGEVTLLNCEHARERG